MTISVQSIQPIPEKNEIVGYAAVYVEASSTLESKCVPNKKRMTMIAKEMENILEGAQDYLLRHMLDDDLGDEAKNALYTAAMGSAYLKHYYDTTELRVVYYPTCNDLILNHNFIDEAAKFYYREQDDFPPEYSRAVRYSVHAIERNRRLEARNGNGTNNYVVADESDNSDSIDDDDDDDDDDDNLLSPSMHVRIDADIVDNSTWRDVFDSIEGLSEEDEDGFSSSEVNHE